MSGSGRDRGRWGTAVALGAPVLFLSALDPFLMIAVPLSVLLLGLTPPRGGAAWFGAAVLVWVMVLVPATGNLGMISRGWALLLGGVMTLVTALRPSWGLLPRALATLGVTTAGVGGWLAATGGWVGLDWMFRGYFRAALLTTHTALMAMRPESPWVQGFGLNMQRVAELQADLFPALLALQSLAALALAWWALARLSERWEKLASFREFRFHDGLVWVVVAGLLLLLLPLGEGAARIAANLLLFMGVLYALRGVAVFVFLARGAPSLVSVLFGAFVALFLYPLVLTAALLVGLGDTWLDVRSKAVAAPPA